MAKDIIKHPGGLVPFVPTREQESQLGDLLTHAKAQNTRDAYRRAWEAFSAWSVANGYDPLPASPKHIAHYLADLDAKGKAPATLTQHAAAIRMAHRAVGIDPSPTSAAAVTEVLGAARRKHVGEEEVAAPILWDLLCKMLEKQPSGVHGLRNRALLLVGWCGALRRSELAKLALEEVVFSPTNDWIEIHFRRATKGDQAKGAVVPIRANPHTPALCPVAALRAWLSASGCAAGAIFRSWTVNDHLRPKAMGVGEVNRLVHQGVKACGLAPEPYSAHSLRAGFVTQAFKWKIAIERIQTVTRHKDIKVLMRYYREVNRVLESAASDIWREH